MPTGRQANAGDAGQPAKHFGSFRPGVTRRMKAARRELFVGSDTRI